MRLVITPTCPKCQRAIPEADVNVAQDVAFCRNCNAAHKLSTLARGSGIDSSINLSQPPKGVSFEVTGLATVIRATHRSLSGAVFLLLFSAFWNGILLVFLGLATASTLALFGIAMPEWFPKPILNGSAMGAGITIFLWIFLLPFIAIGLAMFAAFLSCLGGRTEIRVEGGDVRYFAGMGPIGSRRQFKKNTVKDVRIEDETWTSRKGHVRERKNILIEFTEGKPFKLGGSLSDERRQFVAAATRRALLGS